jgi:hypothetical protein
VPALQLGEARPLSASARRERRPQFSKEAARSRFLRQHGGDPAPFFREENSENRMVKRKDSRLAEILGEVRNTQESPRAVVAVRLSDSERKRISLAAEARNLAFSSFVRWAALQAASDQLRPKRPTPKPAAVERAPLANADTEDKRIHYVDGEPIWR